MSFLASLAMLTVLVPQGTPQGQGPQDAAASQPGVLTPAERLTLRKLLATYLAEDAEYEQATGKDREKASRGREKARNAFDEAWRKADAKGALGSMADLRGIFENCFVRKAPAKSLGQLWTDKSKEGGFDFGWYLPKNYKHTAPTRTIWTVTGAGTADGTWTKPGDWFAATWDKSASAGDTIFHVAMPQAGMELDPAPDYSRESGEVDEQRRIQFMWGTFAEVMLNHNVDRNRLYLDCGRGSCGFALRFLSMFPDRFAGAVLRAPSEVDAGVRFGTLLGLPILLLRAPANAAVVDALKARLDEASPNTTTVLDVTDEYPHKGATAQIEEWLQARQRSMVPKRVVIEPNSDKYNRAYWADIEVAERLVTAGSDKDKMPRLEVQADRAANRITVKAVGVERFTLLLNDDIVDLGKPFTVVVNDKAFEEKKTRSFPEMLEMMITRSDWEFLFPARFTTVVPK
jgi:hypothetical protein